MRSRIAAALFACTLAWLVPLEAAACPLCIAAQDEGVQIAYLGATAFMIALPLGLVGGFALWLRRRARQLADAEGR